MARKSTRRSSRYGDDGATPPAPAPAATPAAAAGSYGDRKKLKWTKARLAARARSIKTRTGSNHRDTKNGRYA